MRKCCFNHRQLHKLACYCLISFLLSACSASSVFVAYPGQAQQFKQAAAGNNTSAVLEKLDRKRNSADKILYLMERGRTLQMQGDFSASLEDYRQAIEAQAEFDDKAKLSASDTAAKGAALLTNDNAIPYQAAPFEQILLHHYQALNYLFLNDIQGAAVEARRANMLQKELLEKHDKAIAKAEKQARDKDLNVAQSDYAQHQIAVEQSVGAVASAFQIAYSFYITGIIYEATGYPNDAYIDYKKALAMFPKNRYLQADLVRLAARLGMREDLASYQQRYNIKPSQREKTDANIIVFIDENFVVSKKSVNISIPTFNGWVSIAMPVYADRPAPRQGASLNVNNEQYRSDNIAAISALAVKNLKDNYTQIAVRQTLRAITKYNTQKQAAEQGGLLLGFATQVFNLISEQADQRSWLTLPSTADIIRADIPSNTKQLTVRIGSIERQIDVDLRAGKSHLLWIRKTPSGFNSSFTHL